MEVQAGFTSRSSVVAERGESAEEIDQQNAEDKKRADALGLKYETQPGTNCRTGGGRMIAEFKIGKLSYRSEIAYPPNHEIEMIPPLGFEDSTVSNEKTISVFRLRNVVGGIAHYEFSHRIKQPPDS
jgi:hypothetical protein